MGRCKSEASGGASERERDCPAQIPEHLLEERVGVILGCLVVA